MSYEEIIPAVRELSISDHLLQVLDLKCSSANKIKGIKLLCSNWHKEYYLLLMIGYTILLK